MTGARGTDVTVRTRPRRDEVRARVLEAARGVFAERGFAGASTDLVAAAAGFTKGAVYSNFGSKDDLFLALMTAEGAARVAAVEQALAGTTDLPGALAAVGAQLSRPDPAWQLLYLEFWQRAVRDPAVRTAFTASRRELRSRVAAAVERFLAEHPVQTGWDAGRLTVVILALTHGLALESLPDPGAVPDDVLPRVLADLLDAAP
ncbi:TetR/AcrR family transcriptional regulator [Klenkia brasiliensis]|uniref:TetR/AcrR family transcriptional regulator n=1 Tax=Klenkia brasiliensis TaxID=333142 RepID=UPI001A968AED|nr:TetR/AcrR family transcriptional regulator [Klenkia brasiliensis]